jgi:hypothetical protein
VGSDGIIVLSPSLDHHLGLSQGVEYLSIEQLISQFPIEALVVAVLPGASWLDIEGLHSQTAQPLTHGLSCEFPAVVRSDILGDPMLDK